VQINPLLKIEIDLIIREKKSQKIKLIAAKIIGTVPTIISF